MVRGLVALITAQIVVRLVSVVFFFFNDTATTEIYTLSLHDALPISVDAKGLTGNLISDPSDTGRDANGRMALRSEEHTSELQSRLHLVCRLLLEKKKIKRGGHDIP